MGAIVSSIPVGGIQVTLNYHVPWAMDNLFGVGSFSENMSVLLGWTTWKVLEQAGNPKPFVAFMILSTLKKKQCLYQDLWGPIRFPVAQGRLHPVASGVSGLQVRNEWWWGWGTVDPYIILIQWDAISLQEHRQLAIRTIWVQFGLNHLPKHVVAKRKGFTAPHRDDLRFPTITAEIVSDCLATVWSLKILLVYLFNKLRQNGACHCVSFACHLPKSINIKGSLSHYQKVT